MQRRAVCPRKSTRRLIAAAAAGRTLAWMNEHAPQQRLGELLYELVPDHDSDALAVLIRQAVRVRNIKRQAVARTNTEHELRGDEHAIIEHFKTLIPFD